MFSEWQSYASELPCHSIFSSIGPAYNYWWYGSGFVNAGLDHDQGIRALKWAIRSCYGHQPTLNIVLVPQARTASPLACWIEHCCVQKLISIPRGACRFTVPSFMAAACEHNGSSPSPGIHILVVANAQGMAAFWPSSTSGIASALKSALHAADIARYVIHTVNAVPSPLPQPPHLRAFAAAILSPETSQFPSDSPCAQRAWSEVLPQAPPLRFDPQAITYTDGSKQGTSLTAAWVRLDHNQSQSVRINEDLGARNTPLRGELTGLHAAMHTVHAPYCQPLHIMTDSRVSLLLIAAHLVRPNHHRYHKHRWLVVALSQNALTR